MRYPKTTKSAQGTSNPVFGSAYNSDSTGQHQAKVKTGGTQPQPGSRSPTPQEMTGKRSKGGMKGSY